MDPIPSLSVPPSNYFSRRSPLLGKLIGMVLLALLQLVPLVFVEGLLTDRLERRNEATQEITASTGANQQIVGPILIVPYRYYTIEKKAILINNQTVLQDTDVGHDDLAYFLPSLLKTEGQATPQKLHKGIYQAVVYDASLQISGEFQPPNFAPFKLGKYDILWDKAILAVPVLDLRGEEETIKVHLGDHDLLMLPGSTFKVFPQGIHADIPDFKAPAGPIPFSYRLDVRGSGDLQFAPIGMENVIHLTSTWPDPSFHGAFLPSTRTITSQGFDATWKVSYYGRNFPQQWLEVENLFRAEDLNNSFYGVSFIILIDAYRNVERAIKYGILLIALIFITFFLFEVLAKLRLHLIQYSLASAALVLFYLALLSLSEFVSFGFSYLIAAGLSTVLITAYCSKIIGRRQLVLGLTGGLVAVYGALYVILQLEDYSLLVGTAVLLSALATVMYVTRNVNWYGDETE